MALSRRAMLAWLMVLAWPLVVSADSQSRNIDVLLKQCKRKPKDTCPPAPPAPGPGNRGPQQGVTQPGESYAFTPGDTSATIQSAVTAQSAGTTFWFPAGTYPITSAITPKTGDTFVGQYGAIMDASGWGTVNKEDGVFKSLNNGITGVTIRNLVIQDGPEYGINAYLTAANWTIQHCDIHGFRNGVSTGINGMVRDNVIHDNIGDVNGTFSERGGGYTFNSAIGTSLINNEIYGNGQEQKFIYGTTDEPSQNYTITYNFVHHNYKDGLWIDANGFGSIVANNICDDNGRTGITIEIATTVTVQNNICRRNAEEGILISATRDSIVTGNLVEGNAGGIGLFLHAPRLEEVYPFWVIDMVDNVITSNTIHVPSGGHACLLTFQDVIDTTPWTTNAKNNDWQSNTYFAPNTTGNWFVWGNGNTISFTSWQALPQDSLGTIAAE